MVVVFKVIKKMSVFLKLLFLLLLSTTAYGSMTGPCYFRGYGPADTEVVEVKQIKAPKVKLQKRVMSQMSNFFGRGALAANFLMHSSKLLEIAPYFAPVLGITGVVFGSLKAATGGGAQRIVTAVNNAIIDLSIDITMSMKNMKDIVDNTALRSEKLGTVNGYKALSMLVTECMNPINRKNTKEKMDQCMIDALSVASVNVDQYLIHRELLKDWNADNGNQPDKMELRRVESRMKLFREYATHVMKLVTSLTATFCNSTYDAFDPTLCSDYKKETGKKLEEFKTYADGAVGIIKKMHKLSNCDGDNIQCGGFKENSAVCVKYFYCQPKKMELSCWCTLDKYMTETPCKRQWKRSFWYDHEEHTHWSKSRLRERMSAEFRRDSGQFAEKRDPFIAAYWKAEVEDMVASWQQLADSVTGTRNVRGEVADAPGRDVDQLFKPSKNALQSYKKLLQLMEEMDAKEQQDENAKNDNVEETKEEEAEQEATEGPN